VPSAPGVSKTEANTEQRLAAVVVSVTAVELPSSTFTQTLPSRSSEGTKELNMAGIAAILPLTPG